MATKLFLNLPVKNLEKSMAFFEKLGFTFNMQFTNELGACMIVSETIFVMLVTEQYFKTFTKKTIADAHKSTEVLIGLDAENKQAVDEMVKKAVAAGGSIYMEPKDHGWMYIHSFADLDGHQWEVFHIDEQAIPKEL